MSRCEADTPAKAMRAARHFIYGALTPHISRASAGITLLIRRQRRARAIFALARRSLLEDARDIIFARRAAGMKASTLHAAATICLFRHPFVTRESGMSAFCAESSAPT